MTKKDLNYRVLICHMSRESIVHESNFTGFKEKRNEFHHHKNGDRCSWCERKRYSISSSKQIIIIKETCYVCTSARAQLKLKGFMFLRHENTFFVHKNVLWSNANSSLCQMHFFTSPGIICKWWTELSAKWMGICRDTIFSIHQQTICKFTHRRVSLAFDKTPD